jgi:hypothetical protein
MVTNTVTMVSLSSQCLFPVSRRREIGAAVKIDDHDAAPPPTLWIDYS